MIVRKTSDELYPIEIEDSWGVKNFIDRWTLEDIEKWNAFVKLLEDVREEILKGSEEVTDEYRATEVKKLLENFCDVLPHPIVRCQDCEFGGTEVYGVILCFKGNGIPFGRVNGTCKDALPRKEKGHGYER